MFILYIESIKFKKNQKLTKKVLTIYEKKSIINLRFKQKPFKKRNETKKIKKAKKSLDINVERWYINNCLEKKRKKFFEN